MRCKKTRPDRRGATCHAIQRLLIIGNPRKQWRTEDTRNDSRFPQSLHRLKAQIWPWRSRLEQARKLCVRRRNRDVHHESVAPRNLHQQIDVPFNQP